MNPLPRFATNRPDNGETVAGAIKQIFASMRETYKSPPPIAIATAYINPGGFLLISEELNEAPRIRLLLGAEPDPAVTRSLTLHLPGGPDVLEVAVNSHVDWLAAERDALGFTRDSLESAKKMVEWLRSHNEEGLSRVEVRRYGHGFLHGKAFIAEGPFENRMLAGSSNMTYAGLALNVELNLAGDHEQVEKTAEWFEHYWEQSQPFDLAELYEAQWAPYTPWQVFTRMLYELYAPTLSEDERFDSSWFKLTSFQQDGVRRMKRLLNTLGGVLVADEVGLGKSFMAGEVIREASEENKQHVLILCPASIKTSMWEPFLKKYGFNRRIDVMTYDKLREDLSEDNPDIEATLSELEQYALVVVDEAHNLRNISAQRSLAAERAILAGGMKKVVLLTATPVNNSLLDLNYLLRYFIRNDAQFAHLNIPSILEYIKDAMRKDPETLSPEHLFDLMDQVAVKRTRKFIKNHYRNDKITAPDGSLLAVEFPEPHPYKIEYELDDKGSALIDAVLQALQVPDDEDKPNYQAIKHNPNQLILARYLSSRYRTTEDLEEVQLQNAGLLRSALLKRLESSPLALRNTLRTMLKSHTGFLEALKHGHVLIGSTLNDWAEETSSGDANFDDFLDSLDEEDKEKVAPLSEYRADDLIDDVTRDIALLEQLAETADIAQQESDTKFQRLLDELTSIAEEASKPDPSHKGRSESDRRKVIVFSSFSDTIIDLHERLTASLSQPSGALAQYSGRLAPPVMGTEMSTKAHGDRGGVDQSRRAHVLAGFAPKTIGLDYLASDKNDLYDILLTTDVLAEGVNLQQAGRIINYDLPWNPMRIVQRHGRVDRIGSPHPSVELGLFFPAEKLDEMLGLEETIRRKVAQAEAAVGSVGLDVFSSNKGIELILDDPTEAVAQIKELLINRGAPLAQSGEEFRRRLHAEIRKTKSQENQIKALPRGIGSGFINPRVGHSGYVFCLKMGSQELPWFRFVETSPTWEILSDESGQPKISGETLVNLVIADPESESTARELSDEAYDRAFDAWELARADAFTQYDALTDPKNLESKPPKAFKDAKALVSKSGKHLTPEQRNELSLKLQSVPPKKIERSVRKVLQDDGLSDKAKIDKVSEILENGGIVANRKPEPLPQISIEQVELVAWMAVEGTLTE